MPLLRVQSPLLWLLTWILMARFSYDLAGADNCMSVVGELYDLVPGES